MTTNLSNTVQVGDALIIDGNPNAIATVEQKFSAGVYILTTDKWRIPFTWEELESRGAEIVEATNEA